MLYVNQMAVSIYPVKIEAKDHFHGYCGR
uniref:Uncharacterized protein n=1 Tax=Arundo donax TaxID=35708 RepID=A0A0A8ZPY2_ARUDO